MFEVFCAPSVYIGNTAVLSLYASGRTSGCVFESGSHVDIWHASNTSPRGKTHSSTAHELNMPGQSPSRQTHIIQPCSITHMVSHGLRRVHAGHGVSNAVPVYEGYALPHSIQQLTWGGQDANGYLVDLLKERGYLFTTPSS